MQPRFRLADFAFGIKMYKDGVCDLKFYKIVDKWMNLSLEIVNIQHLGYQGLRLRVACCPHNPEHMYIMKIVPIL